MFRLLTYAKNYKKEIILGPFFKLLEAIFELMLPLYMAKLIDEGIQQKNWTVAWQIGGKMLLMTFLGLICVMICQYYASIASQGFGTELRKVVFKKINQLSYADLDFWGTDTLVTRITSDVNQMQLALAMLIRLVIRAPFLSIGSMIMAFYIHPTTAIIFAIVLPVFFFILVLLIKKTVPLFKAVQRQLDSLTRTIQENLMGIRVIRAFAKQPEQTDKTYRISDKLADNSLKASNISALLNPLTTLIMNIGIIALLYFGGNAVQVGTLNQGEMVALVNYLMQMLTALIVVSNLVVIFTRASTSASRINELLEIDEIEENTTLEVNSNKPMRQIAMSHVYFKYPKQNGWSLEDITFHLKKRQTLGIIGPTGSGKTSLIQLLPKFYSYDKGEISFFGKNLAAIPSELIRESIKIVPQKSQLVSGTIASNLRWGKSEATETEMWTALEIVQAKEFVEKLPQQLDSPVTQGGDNFSGGQKQRLSIARAIIGKPELLILDDSLSALDYQTDLLLRQKLQSTMPDTTTIIISQRISSIKEANQILVMEQGKITAQGTHEELLQKSATYQQLAKSQLTKEETSNGK